MPRLASLLSPLVVAAACAANPAPAPIVANAKPVARYTLQPLHLHDGMGRHSSFQSWTTVTGSLEIDRSRVTLTLTHRQDVSPVFCPDRYVGMQACAPRDATATTHTHRRVLTGDGRWDAGVLRVEVAHEKTRMVLACSDVAVGYACSVERDDGQRFIGDKPTRYVFAAPAPRTFALVPVKSAAGADVTGAITLRPDATAEVTLATDAKAISWPATVQWTGAGMLVTAGPPLSRLTFICSERTTELGCEVSADRSVLGEPDHLTGQVTLALRTP